MTALFFALGVLVTGVHVILWTLASVIVGWTVGTRLDARLDRRTRMMLAERLGQKRERRAVDRAPRVSVVIPAMNEEQNLPHVLNELPSGLHEVVLVDGNSTDRTTEVARETLPSIWVVEQPGRGKGDALLTGFEVATGEVIVTLDADGSADPAEIPEFVQRLREGADFVKGSRFLDDGGSADITVLRRLGNWALTRTVNALYETEYTDLCYGYNAMWSDCVDAIQPRSTGFEVETELNVRAAKVGLNVAEIPSFELPRMNGTSNLRTFRDGFRVLGTILRESSLNPASWSRSPQPVAAPRSAQAPSPTL